MQIDADDNIIGHNTQEEQNDNIIAQEEQNDNIIDESEEQQDDTHLVADTTNDRKKVRIMMPSEEITQPNPENEENLDDRYGPRRREGL
eukprot:12325260-Ditylum_brightwellii.AAC.1